MDYASRPLPPSSAWETLVALPAHWLRLHAWRLVGYTPKIRLHLETRHFTVKTVDDWEELQEVLKLRHEIFHREFLDRTLPFGLDIDEIDFACDHLVIRDNATRRLVGAYRLTSTKFSRHFYAQSRFDLEAFLKQPGGKIELGRACVDRAHRNGVTLQLLWRGIAAYMKAAGAEFLFGSASIRSQDPKALAPVWDYLWRHGHVTDAYGLRAKTGSVLNGLAAAVEALAEEPPASIDARARGVLPPLFQSYLRGGALVACLPAVDPHMGSTDFLTVLPVTEMKKSFLRRYG